MLIYLPFLYLDDIMKMFWKLECFDYIECKLVNKEETLETKIPNTRLRERLVEKSVVERHPLCNEKDQPESDYTSRSVARNQVPVRYKLDF